MACLVVIGRERGIKTEDLLVYTLGPMHLSLACPDGGLMKTHKANVLHYLEDKTPSSVASRVPPNSVWILDALAILQNINLREIPKTFGELATLYLKKVEKIARESSAKTVHLVTDQYPTVSLGTRWPGTLIYSLHWPFRYLTQNLFC